MNHTYTKKKNALGIAVISGLMCFITVLSLFLSTDIFAQERRNVKVAFFPMDGFHTTNADGSLGGMDVEYLSALSSYAHWDVEYVECESWEDALNMLKEHTVDLVGSAQYSDKRAEIFQYASLSSGYTFGVIATDDDSTIAYEDFTRMGNITYGMVSGYVRKDEFLEYMKGNGIISPNILEYESTAQLQQALSDGEFAGLTRELIDNSLVEAGLTANYIEVSDRIQARQWLNDGTIDVLAYCTDTEYI